MRPFLPGQPRPDEPDDDWESAARYRDRESRRGSADYGAQRDSGADRYTEPPPAEDDFPSSSAASNKFHQGTPVRRRGHTEPPADQIDRQRRRSSTPISPSPDSRSARAPTNGQPSRRRRRARRNMPFNAPPWVVRLALLVGLIVLGVRAGIASASFMAPGGDILGWSRLPVVQCVLCHLPNSTATQQLTPAQYAATLLPHLTQDQKLGQMIMVQFAGYQTTPDIEQMITNEGAGGVLLFEYNIESASQVEALNAQLKQYSPIPLITAVDQEGGTVNRLDPIVGDVPPASTLTTPQAAEAQGVQDATWLHEFGFNLNLAPVVDVGTANPQLYERTFGSDPATVENLAGAYLQGLQQNGQVTGTLKHFPGLGSTTVDPHLGLPILQETKAEWESTDLDPYRVLLKTGDVRAIMVTHEMVPFVDPNLPASLSPALINGVLRGELGFNGVVVTDDLNMNALNPIIEDSIPQGAVMAIEAGADLVVGPADPQITQQTIDDLKAALASGKLSQAAINAAVTRVLTLKIQMGLIPLPK